MVKIKSAAEIDSKYRGAIGRVPAAYKDGITKTTGWHEKAIAGQALYEEKMSNAAILARREKALQAVSDEDWKSKAATLGAERIGRGMTENAAKRTKNYEPYRKVIEDISIPTRVADPNANIDNRLKPIALALYGKKKEIKG